MIMTGNVSATVKEIVARHGATRDALIPILSDVNRELGYIPGEALTEISQALHVPKSQIFSVATFYSMLSVQPRGRHVIQFCENAPCHVVGGRQVWERLQAELGLHSGETSPDNKWTLLTTSCVGLCSVAPLVIVDDDVFGSVTPDQVPDILARYV
jgi:NADH-quinone oxidoreductase subunit E